MSLGGLLRIAIIGLAMLLGVFAGWVVGGFFAFSVIVALWGSLALDAAYTTAILLGIIGAACGSGLAGWAAARITRPPA